MRLSLAGAVLIGVAFACPVAAQGPAVPPQGAAPGSVDRTVPKLQSPSLSLDEAVRNAVNYNTSIALQNQTLQLLTGRAQQARGIFDPLFRITPAASFTQQQAAPALVGAQRNTRSVLAAIQQTFTQLTGVLQAAIKSDKIAPPRCPASLVFSFGGFNFSSSFLTDPVNVERIDPRELTLLGTKKFLAGSTLGDLLGGIPLSAICTDPRVIGLSPENYFEIFRELAPKIDQSGGQGLIGLLTSIGQIPRETRLLQLQITDTVAARARLALQRLGPIPEDELERTTSLDITLQKVLRNGLSVTGEVTLQSFDKNFRDKPYDPTFGGLGQPPEFDNGFSVTFDVPLARGLGATAAAAPERSARYLVNSERENLRQQVSDQAFRTSLAYLNLVAAQETLTSLQDSATRQDRIAQLTAQAVAGGDIPAAEGDRARARSARVAGSVSAARSALVTARASLADTIGVGADDVNGLPMATETFRTSPSALESANALVARALMLRRDVRGREQRQTAAEVLAAGARVDARPRFDAHFTAGLNNLYESPIYKFLPDEVNPIIPAPAQPPGSAIHYYSPTGYYRAVKGRYEPFVMASLTFELPIGNNQRRGRLRQTEASVSASRIETEDLRRTIRDNIVDLTGQLQRALASLQQWEAAVRSDDLTLQGALQRFETRDLTLIDTLTTEERVTQDRLELVRQRQVYLSALARLKFETGELVTFDNDTLGISGYKFDPSTLVGR